MICPEDNTLRCERDYHEGLHCTIDPINKGKQRDQTKGQPLCFWRTMGRTKGQPLCFYHSLFRSKQSGCPFLSFLSFLLEEWLSLSF